MKTSVFTIVPVWVNMVNIPNVITSNLSDENVLYLMLKRKRRKL